jgi:hypothetical protein
MNIVYSREWREYDEGREEWNNNRVRGVLPYILDLIPLWHYALWTRVGCVSSMVWVLRCILYEGCKKE